jgi:hypothetical protein
VAALRRTNGFGPVAQLAETKPRNSEQAAVANDRHHRINRVLWPVSEMLKTALLTNDDPRRSMRLHMRPALETSLPASWPLSDNRGEILCAAGLRFFDDGVFSERYLDNAIEMGSARYRPDR